MAGSERTVDPQDDDFLPDHSLLSLEQYLAMQRSIGNETRFLILTHLTESGPQRASGLGEHLDIAPNTLHYHLNQLVDVGLVENRKRAQPDSNGLHSYYRATALGEGILSHGIRQLMREEWESLETYEIDPDKVA